MLGKLKIVQGALSTKNFTPILKSFRICNGWVIGSNSRMSITVFIEELAGLDITLPADKFVKAINACTGEPTMKVTEGGRLSISSGKFRAYIPLQNNQDYPMPQMQGEPITGVHLLEPLKQIRQFIGDDITRPWACGCLFENNWLYATNNTAIVRVPFETNMPVINIPAHTVTELLRIKKEPVSMRISEGSMTLELEDNVWIQTALLDLGWPNTGPLFDYPFEQLPPLPEGLLQAVEQVLPFCDDPRFPRIYFGPNGVATEEKANAANVTGLQLPVAVFRGEPLVTTLRIATHGDFSGHPKPCPFYGLGGVQGVVIGLRLEGL